MRRVPRIDPGALTGAEAELYAHYATGARAEPGADFRLLDDEAQLLGPPSTWMVNAPLGLGLERLGREIRYHLTLPSRSREIVILRVAEAEDSAFERYAHRLAGLRAGLTTDEIAELASGRFVARDASEAVLVDLVDALLLDHELSDELWTRATGVLGAAAVFEVVTLVGWYRMMALQLRAFQVIPPEKH